MVIRNGKVWIATRLIDNDPDYSEPAPPENERGKYVSILNHDWGNNTAKFVQRYEVETGDGNRFWVGANWLCADAPSDG